uniref:Uncharacterized protein n=1 Tax=uncultured marine group II/III euryarchaeote AD1000_88_G11 TaxID=1457822 RepID=A0A075FYY0_9EURY|nr:hypothetical protein [uncultured marine group II/III euryarchaeote AD1000_88_G11]
MSCENASAPLNLIKDTNMLEKCNIVCDYKANYPVCRGLVKNKGSFLSITMDQCGGSVTYNKSQFKLNEVRIYQPSLHAWSGEHALGEVVLMHTRNTIVNDQPDKLFVCIPFRLGSSTNSWFSFMSLIPSYYENQDSAGSAINMPGWSLNLIVPKGDYYNYQGSSPFGNCADEVEYVVYSLEQAALINNEEYKILKSSLPVKMEIQTREWSKGRWPKLFYHSGGGEAMGDVYLDCSPINADKHEADPKKSLKKEDSINLPMPAWEPILITGGSLIGLIILIKVWNHFRDN